ncbi:restriction endonuclease subunit S [Aurantimonas sp. E1-2-R+4]|uniref:restriction endonuclease subunit S n=1 Tax=Aurantimonas sp. E1-2-R+4 TaxID=3113714 RepID=UPI002F93EC18
MSEWETEPASDFCLSVRDGTHDSPKPVEVGRKLITSRHMISGNLDLEKAYLISADEFEDINRRSKVDRWDVLISMIGTVGEVYLEQNDPDYAIKNIGLFKSRSERRGRWLHFYLKIPEVRAELRSRCRGTTQLYVPLGELRSFPVTFPSDEGEQDDILEILSCLDDKIALNRRTNETLEAMAQAIFRDWFVDFGPTRRKIEGASDPVMIMGGVVTDLERAQQLTRLFPASLRDGGFPEGWKEGSLADVARTASTVVSPAEIAPETPYIGLEHMPRRSIALNEWEAASKVTSNKSRFERGQILFGKLRPYFHKVGIAPVDGVCSTDIIVLDAIESHARPMVAMCVATDEFVGFTDQGSTGTKMPRTSWGNMKTYPIALAPQPVIEEFGGMVLPMMDKIVAGIHGSRTLSATRDLLLPKLMSGEIRLAEAVAEAAE